MRFRSLGVFVAVFIALFPTGAQAQKYAVDKGSWLAGGNIGFQHSNFDTGGHLTEVSFQPFGGYFVAPGLAIMVSTGFFHATDGDSGYTDLSIGPEIRYYFGRRAKRFYPFIGGALQHTWRVGDPTALGQPPIAHFGSWVGEGGVAMMVSRDIALTGTAHYRTTTFHFEGPYADSKTNDFGVDFGLEVFLL